ncbi:MAG TPA: zinc metallopeptidase [Anaerolineales bacterium]|nr:zinc metallopeptidase [Anaerolineales bacterium]
MFYFDPMYLMCVALPGMILVGGASWYVSYQMNKWSRIANSRQLNGAQVASHLLHAGRLGTVRLEPTPSGDHYDPRANVLRLTAGIANQPSVTAMAVAAHEVGHAYQDRDNYPLLVLRGAMVSSVNIGSQIGWWLIFGGLMLAGWVNSSFGTTVAWIGVALFALSAVFALVTLPVEFDASSRALKMLDENGFFVTQEERNGARAVLTAAALTYVAAFFQSLLQVLYFAMKVAAIGNRRRD